MPPKGRLPGAPPLPAKERALFTRLVQEYETKKYKLGLKTADAILKKHPEHGETLCMKGLIIGTMGDRAQGLDLAKQGVRKDLMSFISWHALGILNRMDKNYDEAIKCYSQALRIEGGTNLNLIRESSYMNMQARNYPPLIDGRITLVRMQPHIRSNWAALATAYHLAGRAEEAEKVLAQWESTCRDIPPRNYEHSEMLLYRASILLELKRYSEVDTYLTTPDVADRIVDKRALRVMRATALLELGQLADAEPLWRALIADNEEDKAYVRGWLRSKGVAGEQQVDRAKAASALKELQAAFPKSRCAQRMELDFLDGAEFADAATAYLSRALTKGIPSIFADLKPLLDADADKFKAVEVVAQSLLQRYAPSTSSGEPPSSYLWTLYFLSQFYSHAGHAAAALAYIDSAIAHTPTLPELYMTKARILKRAGALEAASHAMEDARLLDGQDRFLNSKDAKYKLRIGEVAAAERVMGLFTKPDAPSPLADLIDMQAIWFVLEEGRAYERRGELHLALKRYAQTERLFQDHWDDQLDFHSYCVRKFTMRDYVDMCRWEDGLRGHAAFVEAAVRAVRICLAVHDRPNLAGAEGADAKSNGHGAATAGLSEEEAKKEQKRLKKLEAKRREEEEKAKAAAEAKAKAKAKSSAAEDDETFPPAPDPDPEGRTLLADAAAKPLEEAKRLVAQLQLHAPRDVRTWSTTFEVARRERNWLACARALRRGRDLLAGEAEGKGAAQAKGRKHRDAQGTLHLHLLTLLRSMPDLSNAPAEVKVGIDAALDVEGLRPASEAAAQVPLRRVAEDRLQKTGDVLAYVKALRALGEASAEVREAALNYVRDAHAGATLEEALALEGILREDGDGADAGTQAFREAAHKRFPLAEEFFSEGERRVAREEREGGRRAWEAAKTDGEDGEAQ